MKTCKIYEVIEIFVIEKLNKEKIIQLRISIPAKKLSGGSIFETRVCIQNFVYFFVKV